MSLTTRTLANTGSPLTAPDGTVLAGVKVAFTLVSPTTDRRFDVIDATTFQRVTDKVQVLTDANGEFSVQLWPNSRGAKPSRYLCEVDHPSVDDVRGTVPPGDGIYTWVEFLTGGTDLSAQDLNALELHIANPVGAHAASAISVTATGNITSTTVQAALAELDTEKQPIDADLTGLAGLTPSNDDIIQRKAGAWANRTVAQLVADLVTATVLTVSSTATVTAKSIDLASNTVTGTLAQFNTALSDGDFASLAGIETLTNKTISGASNTLSNIANASLTNSSITIGSTSVSLGGTANTLAGLTLTTPVLNGLPTGTGVATANTVNTLVARDGSGNFSAGTITATTFVGALTGNASTASAVAVADVTGLLSGGKILSSLMPALAITDTYVVASQAAMLALSAAETGDVAVRTDLNKSFILRGTSYSTLGDWQELLTPTDAVLSVAGRVGAVTLVSADITDATSTNTASRIVIRDGSGNFSAGTVTASLVGTVTGNLTGNVTGNVSGSAATVTAAAQPAITSVGTLTSLATSGNADLKTIYVDGAKLSSKIGNNSYLWAGVDNLYVVDSTGNTVIATFNAAGTTLGAVSATTGAFSGLATFAGGSFSGALEPATGASVEVTYVGGAGYVTAYNRSGSAWTNLNLRGASVNLIASGSTVATIDASTFAITPAVALSAGMNVGVAGGTNYISWDSAGGIRLGRTNIGPEDAFVSRWTGSQAWIDIGSGADWNGVAITPAVTMASTLGIGGAGNPTSAALYVRAGSDQNLEVLTPGLSATGVRIFSRDNSPTPAPLELQGSAIKLVNSSGNPILTVAGSVVNIASLPTSASGLSTGDLWNSAGTLKVA
jgi:hypothetical protein